MCADSEFQELLFEQPYCRISDVISRCNVSQPTATVALNLLASHGLLTELKVGRERLFINHKFMAILSRKMERTA